MTASSVALPANHPQRVELSDEVHARPPEALVAPTRLTFLAVHSDWSLRDRQWRHVSDLATRFGAPAPPSGANHFSADLGPFRVKWERHTEFVRFMFIVGSAGRDPFDPPAIAEVPADWLASLPGRTMVAAHGALVRDDGTSADPETLSARHFTGNPLIGSTIGGGSATAVTDFRIHPDGFSRLLVLDRDLTPRQAGRMMQRLMEIDTYRLMALLALPIARELAPELTARESELAEIGAALADDAAASEPALLQRLTRLEAAVGKQASDSHYRFSAAVAYYDLVEQRIAELREGRIHGLQTFREFTERRLAPAMQTCRAVAMRLESLSARAARTTQLLSTRVDIARQGQNQVLLRSMDRRAALQLRLQQTVEGLSIAAITYYIAGLVGHAAKALRSTGMPIDPDLAIGASVPLVLVLAALGIRRIRRAVSPGPPR